MSPWVRIDENALDHPKIGGLPDGAFRLWVQGLAYCQKFLTNGFISDMAIRGLHAFSPKRKASLMEVGLWDQAEAGIRVHDFLEWNESREHVMAARKHARERIKKHRDARLRNGVTSPVSNGDGSAHEPCGVVCIEEGSALKERGLGKTREQRASAFTAWYEDTHERLFHVGYMGTNADWTKTLELCRKFTDEQMRDGALVWFGMEDDFATKGTRSIPKFASRITDCLLTIKARGIA